MVDPGALNGADPPDDALRASPRPFGAPASVPLLRVIDAAANRAAEGLRVVEDYLRFVLDDSHLTARCKHLRHDLHATLGAIPPSDRHAARDTLADIGTGISTPAERARADVWDACAASFARVAQALRSLEEYGKVVTPALGGRFEALRYQTYTLHRAAAITATSHERLGSVRLLVLVDGCASTAQFAALVDSLVACGVHAIQLRDKSLATRPLLTRARHLRDRTRATGTLMFINDRPDIAVACHADGVHVGQEDLPVKDVRTLAGSELLIGVSTHSLDEARQAVLDGANLIGAGPVFHSATKAFERLPGLRLLEIIGRDIRLPTFAIGGIDHDNLPRVLATGVRRVAVGAAITRSRDPVTAARQLLDRLPELESRVDC